MKRVSQWVVWLLALCLLAGCGGNSTAPADAIYIDQVTLDLADLEDEAVPLAASPAAVPFAASGLRDGGETKRESRD